MTQWLKQSTTVTLKVGPFLDKTDGVTEETAITPVVEVAKNGGAFGARSSATAIAHDAEGWFDVELNTTDTNTLGRLVIKAHDNATHLPVWHEFLVVPANVWDSLIGGGDTLDVTVTTNSDKTGYSISGTKTTLDALNDIAASDVLAQALVALEDGGLVLETGTLTVSTQTSVVLSAGSADNDAYKGCTMVIEDASTATQKAVVTITAYTGATKTATLDAAPEFTIATGDKFRVLSDTAVRADTPGNQIAIVGGYVYTDVQQWANQAVSVGSSSNPAVDVAFIEANAVTATSIASNAVTAAKIAADAIGGSELAADAASEIATAVWAAITRTLTSAANITSTGGTTVPQTGDAFARLGAPAGASTAADIAAVKSETAAIVADTNELQTDWADAGRLDAILDARASQASVDTIDGIVDAILLDTGTDGVVVAAASKTGYALSATGADAVLVDGKTLPAALQIIGAVVAGKISGAPAGPEVFLGLDGVTTRVTVTADSDGNRTSVVYA